MLRDGRWELECMEVLEDVSPADWIVEQLWARSASGVRVGELIPEGFEAYARIFHPAYRATEAPGVEERIAWYTIANWTGQTVHPEMQFNRIAKLPDAPVYNHPEWGTRPIVGYLPDEECLLLTRVLSSFTSTPESCYFCLWEGYGGMNAHYRRNPKVKAARGWEYWLFRGPIHGALGGLHPTSETPNIWWPEDRAWCVVTHVDFSETFVGGTQACIDRILGYSNWNWGNNSRMRFSGLETLQISLDARVDINGDNINPGVGV